MLLSDTPGAVERLKFFGGQRLFADDLQALDDFNRDMRWLHNRSLHQFGIASGYAVTGEKGDRQVTVGSGYALDARGREIVLTESRVIPVPPVANDGNGQPVFYDLTVSYDADPQESETREGICAAQSAVRYRDEPVFCWIELGPGVASPASPSGEGRQAKQKDQRDAIAGGMQIRLARVQVLNCRLHAKVSIAERTNAKPPAQRFVAAGGDHRNSSGTFDRKWQLPGGPPAGAGITIQTTVDTSTANFQSTPDYIAQVIGARNVDLTIDGEIVTMLLDGFVRIEAPTKTGFRLSVLVPAVLIDPKFDLQKVAQALPAAVTGVWAVEWLGIEE